MKVYPHPISVVVIDIDGTLLTLKQPIGGTYAEVLEGLGIDADPRRLEQSCRDVWRSFYNDYLNVAGAYATSHEREEWVWKEFVHRALDGAGVACSADRRERAVSDIYSFFARGLTRQVAVGAEQFLRTMRQREIPVIAATNNDRRTVQVVRELGLACYFRQLLVSGELAWKKPSENFFREISGRIGVAPTEIMHVGNDRDLDVLAARQAGFHAIHFGADSNGNDEWTVRDFRELEGALVLSGK